MKIAIVGANRGIGLELARLYSERGDDVLATCRNARGGLEKLSSVKTVEGIDVRAPDSLKKLGDAVDDNALDMLIVVSGILRRGGIDDPNFDEVQQQLEVNAVGPLRVAHAMLGKLKDGAKLGLLTSRMGSIEDNTSGGRYGYRMSKAALNAAGKSLALDLAPRSITVALLHPGYVQTEMTGNTGHISAEESAKLLVTRMDELRSDQSGIFLHANGEELPW